MPVILQIPIDITNMQTLQRIMISHCFLPSNNDLNIEKGVSVLTGPGCIPFFPVLSNSSFSILDKHSIEKSSVVIRNV